jgi:hypothetical protein
MLARTSSNLAVSRGGGGGGLLKAATKQRVREGTADYWEDLAFPVVRYRVRELVRALHLYLVTIYKISADPITNPNPVSSY